MSEAGVAEREGIAEIGGKTTGIGTNGIWTPAVLGAFAYPLFIKTIYWSGTSQWQARHVLTAIAVALALAVPAVAVIGLLSLRHDRTIGAPRLRRILHFAVATPVLYMLAAVPAGVLAFASGASAQDAAARLASWRDLLWWGAWCLVAIFAWRAAARTDPATNLRTAKPARSGTKLDRGTPRLRSLHRAAGVLLLLAFLALHLANHLAALGSLRTQSAMMEILRLWYRANWIEPIILLLFATSGIFGLCLVARWTRGPSDKFRILQTASGFYLAFFILNHLIAVLGARAGGVNTDWAFATGGAAGILGSQTYAALFVYYVLAVVSVAVHIAVAARMILVRRGADTNRATSVAYIVLCGGIALTVAIAAALLGARVIV